MDCAVPGGHTPGSIVLRAPSRRSTPSSISEPSDRVQRRRPATTPLPAWLPHPEKPRMNAETCPGYFGCTGSSLPVLDIEHPCLEGDFCDYLRSSAAESSLTSTPLLARLGFPAFEIACSAPRLNCLMNSACRKRKADRSSSIAIILMSRGPDVPVVPGRTSRPTCEGGAMRPAGVRVNRRLFPHPAHPECPQKPCRPLQGCYRSR